MEKEDQGNDNICIPVLGNQITGVIIASAIFFFVGGPIIVLLGGLTFADAWMAGIYKKKGVRSILNISPMGWAIVMQGLFILAYPLYMINRNKLKTKPGNNVLFIITAVLGGIFLLLFFVGIITQLMSM